jgi:hypothetical protein
LNTDNAKGTWTLRIRDLNRNGDSDQSHSGTLEGWCLEINSPPLCTLTPEAGRAAPGGGHTVVATVMRDSTPVPNADLRVALTGQNVGAETVCSPATCRTDAGGQLRFTYISNGIAGNDLIEVSGLVGGTPVGAAARMSWFSGSNTALLFEPPLAIAPIFVPYRVRARVVSNGLPVSNAQVVFKVFGGGGNFRREVTTDANGQASLSYSRTQDEADIVRAEATVEGERFSREVTVAWTSGIVCLIDPPAATNKVVGDAHTLLAKVWRLGSPVCCVPVTFLIASGPNADAADATQTMTTDFNGEARFTYTGNGGLGTDRIKISGTTNFQSFSAEAQVTWDTGASLEPKHSVIPRDPSSEVTWANLTFTLQDHGLPVAGVAVDISFRYPTDDHCILVPATGVTDASGQVMLGIPFSRECPPHQVLVTTTARLPRNNQIFSRTALIEFVESSRIRAGSSAADAGKNDDQRAMTARRPISERAERFPLRDRLRRTSLVTARQ